MEPTIATTIGSDEHLLKFLHLDPGAFTSELQDIVGTNKVGWSGEDQLRLIEASLSEVKDEDGNKLNLDAVYMDRIRLIYRQTEELQRRVRRQTLEEAGYKFDEETEKVFDLLLSTAQFADFLAKTNNPQTGKPFVAKEKKRGAKKDTFASLIATASTESEEVHPEEAQKEEAATQAPVRKASKPAPMRR